MTTPHPTDPPPSTAVTDWFGPGFDRLHPLLQALHRHGGRLCGPVTIRFGRGLAGVLGRRIAQRLGVPCSSGTHTLEVGIRHAHGVLYWDRCFDRSTRFTSTFHPHGHWPDGYWTERSGAIALQLQVEVIDGGWQWRCIGARRGRWRLPRWLLPRSEAGKRIESGQYRFDVGFSLPLLGEVLGYGGWLQAHAGAADDAQ